MILYANSCSYGVCSTGKTYADFLGEYFGATVINAGKSGSCNSRIFRTSVRDLVELTKQDEVIACISLGSLYRSEIWNLNNQADGNDGHFESFQPSSINNQPIASYIKEWLRFYNDEAEITNVCSQLIMFTSFLKTNNIRYLIWAGGMNYKKVDINTPFLKSLYGEIEKNSKILDVFDFSFSKYCSIIKGYVPYDAGIYGIYGHHCEEAHKDFADYLINNYEI